MLSTPCMVRTFVLPTTRQPCVWWRSLSVRVRYEKGPWSAVRFLRPGHVQKEKDWSPSLSDIDRADLIQRISQSVDCEDVVTLSGVICMFVGSGKKVAAGSSVLSDMVLCQQQRRERSLGCMTAQGDVEQCSIGRELSGDETDSASV